jgi:hypothetical protein
MASPNNLRIIYENWVDLLPQGGIVASSTQSGSTTNNLKLDTKSKVWKSGAGTASLKMNLGGKKVGGVILAFSNLISSSATIRVVAYPSEPAFNGNQLPLPPSQAITYNTGLISCCPWNNLALASWGTNPAGSSNYSYGGGTYARVWIPEEHINTPVQWLGIQITDVGNANIEVSRLIVGPYWSPRFNTEYGISAGIEDMSEHSRTESGDLITRRGPRYKTLNFGLQYLHQADRKEMTRIFMGNGISKPIFVSIFPDSTGDDVDYQREGLHQIYGKMKQIPGISYDYYEMYATSMELEEV